MPEWDSPYEPVRIQYLMEQVMNWECYISWESYRRKYGANEYALGAGVSFTTPTCVAFCNPGVYYRPKSPEGYKAEWRVFTPDHETLFTFDPLHKMEDAWRIVERMTSFMGYDHPTLNWSGPTFKPRGNYIDPPSQHCAYEFVNGGYMLNGTCWYVLVEYDGLRHTYAADTAQEAICLAAAHMAPELRFLRVDPPAEEVSEQQ